MYCVLLLIREGLVSYSKKTKEVQFHIDRSIESSVNLIKSITTNPILTDDNKFDLLASIIKHHQDIANELLQSTKKYNNHEVVEFRLNNR